MSHLFSNENLKINDKEMKQISRQQDPNNLFSVCFVHKMNNDHHVGCHEDFSILLFEHVVHEIQSKTAVVLENPVCAYTFDIDCIGLKLRVLNIFAHGVFKVFLVHVGAVRWANDDDVLGFGS